MKLVGYCRVSTEEQERQGLSLPAQEDRIRAFATALQHEITEVIVETSSAKVPFGKRYGGARVLQRLNLGRADGIAILRLDRLTRTLKDLLEIVEDSKLKGWSIVSATETLDTSTPPGRLVVQVLGMVAEFERETTIQRTKEALHELRKQGKRYSGRIPYGYMDKKGLIVPDSIEQVVIEGVLKGRAKGFSWEAIAKILGKDGSRTGRPWHPDVLRRCISRHERKRGARAAA
jgi:DNA invertase Pin-like site-specific DNA recombinase